jgi:hypothetical protein
MSEQAGSIQRTETASIGLKAGLEGLRARVSDFGDPVYLKPRGIIRLRVPRMTVRLLLVIVALAGLATEAALIGWRAWSYRKWAAEHARYLRSSRSFIYDSSELRGWHDQMRRKYERATLRPWLPVEPDPPPPEWEWAQPVD